MLLRAWDGDHVPAFSLFGLRQDWSGLASGCRATAHHHHHHVHERLGLSFCNSNAWGSSAALGTTTSSSCCCCLLFSFWLSSQPTMLRFEDKYWTGANDLYRSCIWFGLCEQGGEKVDCVALYTHGFYIACIIVTTESRSDLMYLGCTSHLTVQRVALPAMY